jgi:hypothetical protein
MNYPDGHDMTLEPFCCITGKGTLRWLGSPSLRLGEGAGG